MPDSHANKISSSKQYIDRICRRTALAAWYAYRMLVRFLSADMVRLRLAGTKYGKISNGELGASCISADQKLTNTRPMYRVALIPMQSSYNLKV